VILLYSTTLWDGCVVKLVVPVSSVVVNDSSGIKVLLKYALFLYVSNPIRGITTGKKR
jgi:hypothetical protein